jgi:hypothetical protein
MTFAPRTWVVGETVTAALMNQEIRDQFNSFFGAWTVYAPTWTASTTNPSLGNGTLAGRYVRIGRTITVAIKLTTGTTTTYGSGSYRWALPAAASSSQDVVGTAFIGDATSGYSTGISYISASNADIAAYIGAPGAAFAISPTVPQTFATGDRIWLAATYAAAS